jgi:peptidoglycan endopeptidase LytF
VFAGGQRYEFTPVAYGRYRGHRFAGHLRPSTAMLAERLSALGLDPAPAPIFAAVSSLEGGFDALQTFDRARLSWGFIQFAGTGGLPALLRLLDEREPFYYQHFFRAAGIDVAGSVLSVSAGGRHWRGGQALNRLHDEPARWKQFLLAAQEPAVQDVQIRAAHDHYWQRALALRVPLGGQPQTLGALLASHPLGQAVLFDRAVNKGLGYAEKLFRAAAEQAHARAADPIALLEAARKLEPRYAARWTALERALAEQRGEA